MEAQANILNRGVPEKADGYKFSVDGIEIPKGITVDTEKIGKSPMMQAWRNLAHENGLPQEVFDAGVKMYVAEAIREKQDFAQTAAKALEPLGKDAKQRIDNVKTMLNQRLGDMAPLFHEFLFSARIVEGFERMFRSPVGGGPGRGSGAQDSSRVSQQDWNKMSDVQKILAARAQAQSGQK